MKNKKNKSTCFAKGNEKVLMMVQNVLADIRQQQWRQKINGTVAL